jgi:predicted nucleotidyltransferase
LEPVLRVLAQFEQELRIGALVAMTKHVLREGLWGDGVTSHGPRPCTKQVRHTGSSAVEYRSLDVDLFVEIELERKTLKNMVALSRFLHDLLGRKVELVTPASLNPFTGKHILNEVEYVAFAA